MVRRNPAFRIATWGLTVAVMLCLVAAISLLNSTVSTVAQTPVAKPTTNSRPIQVATTGEVTQLLKDHPQRPVPDPQEHVGLDEMEIEPLAGDQTSDIPPGSEQQSTVNQAPQFAEFTSPPNIEPVQAAVDASAQHAQYPNQIDNLEVEITQLKGQVNELVRAQLESQLAEIHHAEALLSTHQTNRMIESLEREVDQLKTERTALAPSPQIESDPSEAEPPVASGMVIPVAPSGEILSPEPPVARVRFHESPDVEGRFDVDADAAPLQEFLAQLGPAVGWNLVSGPELQGSVTCRWKGVDLQQALIQLLRAHRWQIQEVDEFEIITPLPQSSSDSVPSEDASTTDTPTLSLDTSELQATAPPPYLNGKGRLPQVRPLQKHPQGQSSFVQISTGTKSPGQSRTGLLIMKDHLWTDDEAAPAQTPPIPLPPAVMQRNPPQPQVEIEATILQTRQLPGAPRGQFRETLTISGSGPCPQCGQVHTTTDVPVGHSAHGWVEMPDGVSCGVCQMSPEQLAQQIQRLADTTVTSTPRVLVMNRQLAEMRLAEQQGFKRQIVHRRSGIKTIEILEGGIQLSLRPTVEQAGVIRLDLRPSTTSTLASASPKQPTPAPDPLSTSLQIPLGSCVVLSGLYFESERPSAGPDRSTSPDRKLLPEATITETYEVLVLIHVRLAGSGSIPETSETHSSLDLKQPLLLPANFPGPVLPANH